MGGQLVAVLARMRRCNQMLAAILDPAQRLSELQRQRGDRDLLRIEVVLDPETAADIGRDHPQLRFGQSDRLRQHGANDVRKLGGAVDDELVEPALVMREHAAAFERHAGVPLHAQAFVNGHRRAGADGLQVAGLDPRLRKDVVGPVVMDGSRAGGERDVDIPDRRQFLEVDGAGLRDVFRLGARGCDADADEIADEADFVGSKRGIFRIFESGRGSHRDDRFCERDVGGEEHAAAVARRYLDGADAPVCDGAAQERDLSQARHLQVGEIGAAAIEQAPVFVSPDRGPNALMGGP